MPKLSSFFTELWNVCAAILSLEQPLPVNTTVSTLELQNRSFILFRMTNPAENQTLFETLFRAFPSIKRFKCDTIDNDEFLLMTREVPALESIEISYLLMNRFPEGSFFPNIKKFKSECFLEELEEPTGDGNFAALVREEMRKYFAERPRSCWFRVVRNGRKAMKQMFSFFTLKKINF